MVAWSMTSVFAPKARLVRSVYEWKYGIDIVRFSKLLIIIVAVVQFS